MLQELAKLMIEKEDSMISKLQEQFEKENDVNVCDSSGKTFQLYIKWLEDKLTEKDSNFANPELKEVMAKIIKCSSFDEFECQMVDIVDVKDILSHYFV